MALVRTTRIGSASATSHGTGAYTSAAFTPSNNSILVVCGGCAYDNEATAFGPTIADSLGGTWTQRATISSTAGGWADGARIWTRPVVTGASMTVSLDHGAETIFAYALSVIEFTGQDGTTPVTGGVGEASILNNADTCTLGAAPVAADYSVGWYVRDMNTGTGTTTPGTATGWTEIHDFTTSGGMGIEAQERTASTSTTVTWDDVATGTSDTFRAFALAINIKAAADSGVTGTVAVTLASFVSAAAGSVVANIGAVAVTLASFAPAVSGTYTPPPITGTVAVTLAAFTPSASGSVGNDRTGTVAVTLATFTPAATGAIGENGSVAVTLASFTPTASGTVTAPGISGTVAVTLGSFTSAASGVRANGLHPVAVSADSRSLVDRHGDPWFGAGDTAWSLTGQLSTANITVYLEDRAARGINLVLFNAVEHLFADNAPNNVNNDPPFTGTAFQTGLNAAYWTVVDHAVNEAARLGITLMICPAYLGFASTEEGWDTEIVAATNGNMTTYGNSLAARYAAYPNITWLIGHDKNPSATEEAREAALAVALAAGTSHLITPGGVEQLGSDAWEGSGVPYDFDTVYFRNTDAPAAQTATGWAASPTMPTGFLEGLYEGDGTTPPRIRSGLYGPLCSGATYTLFGNNPIWQFDTGWEAALDNEGSLDLSVFAAFVTSLDGNWAGMVPDTTDTFLTVGEGTGATRASARFDADATLGVLAVAYRPHSGSASLTFDLTEFTAVATVKIRKFDPSSAAYTTIGTFATTGTQAVGTLGTNAAGDTDWVLVFEQSDDRTGTVAVTLGSFTSSATGTSTPPAFTGTVAVTLASFTAAATGQQGETGTVAVTLATFVPAASGTVTAPSFTGTVAVTLAAFTANALGSFTPAGSGSAAVTLNPFTATASGTVTVPAVTGTVAVTLGGFAAIGTGTFTPLITGTVAVTLGAFVALASQAAIGGTGVGSVVWRDGATGTVGAAAGTGAASQPSTGTGGASHP